MKKAEYKWNFAMGTTSRVPGRKGYHYLIVDIDGYLRPVILKRLEEFRIQRMMWFRTKHGWHLYTDLVLSFKKLLIALKKIGCDPMWLHIGKNRGYFFLADYELIEPAWPVERMVLYRGKRKKVNAS